MLALTTVPLRRDIPALHYLHLSLRALQQPSDRRSALWARSAWPYSGPPTSAVRDGTGSPSFWAGCQSGRMIRGYPAAPLLPAEDSEAVRNPAEMKTAWEEP